MPWDSDRNEASVISLTTILILSAFLIGLAVGKFMGTELEPYVLACGLSGILSFIGLELAAFRRKMIAMEEEKKHLDDRLARHVLSQSSGGFSMQQAKSLAASKADVA